MAPKQKHPKALPYLFFSEMWERFGFYLMLGIFTLYMMDTEKGGLGFDRKTAFDIFGTYIALVYLTPFLGGLLADRVMGCVKAVTLGGILMGIGYLMLAIKGMAFFYTALLIIIIGNGFFKPNISTLLGYTYNADQYRSLKDSGYNIFYMGINIGAFICNFFAAYLRNNFGWGYAFAAAGIGMFIGVIIFWMGMKHYRHVDVIRPTKPEDMPLSRIFSIVFLPALVIGAVGWMIPGNVFGSDSTDAFIFACIPVVGYYASLYFRASHEDKQPIGALLAIFAVVAIFWAVFKQNGTALTTWAENYTDRSLPALIEKPISSINLSQEISADIDTFPKYDHHFRTERVNGELVRVESQHPYFHNLDPEKNPGPGGSVNLISTEIFQSVNPFWVVVLTPVVVAFWGLMRRRNLEPSTPGKIAWGLAVSSLSTLVMVAAVYVGHNGEMKVSPWWLIGCYGVITVGELFLSPMGLSLVSKLSPPRITALMMGGWFLSTSLGNKLSGILATLWDNYDQKQWFFVVNFVLLGFAAIITFLMLKWLKRVFLQYGGGAGGKKELVVAEELEEEK
jgi:POT family proton-dependent oligopeptide transporter